MDREEQRRQILQTITPYDLADQYLRQEDRVQSLEQKIQSLSNLVSELNSDIEELNRKNSDFGR